MQEVILLRGLPASGKSTWAKEQVLKFPGKYKRINKDSLRDMLDANAWSGSNEKFAKKVRDNLIILALSNDKGVIIDDTNINPSHETRVKELCAEYSKASGKDVNFFIKEFIVPINELIRRDGNRDNPVGKTVIKRMLGQWQKHIGDYKGGEYIQHHVPEYKWLEEWEKNEKLPSAYIFDMDGTLSLMNGRNPYDGSTADRDLVNKPVSTIIDLIDYNNMPVNILIFSGRDGKYEKQTIKFLKDNYIYYNELHMRAENDNRKDSIVKLEMYNEHIKGKYHVLGVFDDRPQVRKMWISEGLFVFSCYQDPNFMEF